jgi:hypothetical protein
MPSDQELTVEPVWKTVSFEAREKVRAAIADPGSVIGERLRASDGALEVLSHWQARAALEAFAQSSPPAQSEQPDLADAIERHGEALFAFSAMMLKRKLFPEKGNDLTEAYEAVVQSWAELTERSNLCRGGEDG